MRQMKQMQNRRRKTNGGLCRRLLVLALLVGLLANTVGCAGGQSSTAQDTRNGSAQATETSNVAEQNTAASIEAARNLCGSLSYEGRDTLSYAEQFTVDRYEGGYVLLTIAEDARYLVIPEGKEIPGDLPGNVVPLCQPISHIYLVASAAMDMFVKLDALDAIRFSGMAADGWTIPEAKAAMESGDILYAGKYSAPDYEKILSEGCDLAVENTMVLHTPEVKEQLERLGIPVLIDYSSYETTPQGRMEWICFYGILLGKEEQAREVFEAQVAAMEGTAATSVTDGENASAVSETAGTGTASEGKTVAFFYMTSSGAVNVRKSSDYLPKMIELAGGTYVCPQLKKDETSASSSANVQMEAFYAAAKDADYLIYNSSIDGGVADLQELKGKDELLGKFRAVQEGHVFCTSKNLYQASMELGAITADIRRMLNGETEGFTYLYPLQ